MVAIFAGLGAGFTRGSGNILGGAGYLGASTLGRAGESVSINAATGNLLISQQDEFLIGRGLDIGVSRTYNSLIDAADGDNGDQWQQGSYRRIFNHVAGSSVKRQYADGSVITYNWSATRNAFVTTDGDGAHDTLTFAGGVWTWTDGSSLLRETYSAYGTDNWRITQAQERGEVNVNLVTYSYLGDKLDKITTADGSWLQYSWTGNNITKVSAGYTNLATGAAVTLVRTRLTYDAYNRLSEVKIDKTPDDNMTADGNVYITTYTYHGTSKQVATISQTDGSSLSISYDGSGRVSSLTQTVASGDSRTTSFSYYSNYTNITGPDGQVTRMDYDGSKQLTKITAPPAYSGATAQTVQFAYDSSGNLLSTTDQLAKVSTFTYDTNGNQLTATDPNGNTVTRTYDANNNKLTETRTGSDASGASVALTTRYAYDIHNQLRYMVSAEGHVTEYYYNAYGQNYWTVEYPQAAYNLTGLAANVSIPESSLTTWRTNLDNKYSQITYTLYDARGNVYRQLSYGRAQSGWGNADTSEGYSDTYFTYDHAGRLLSRNRLGEVAETYLYDGMNRLIGSTDLAGGTTNIVFNDAATQTVVTLANGQVTTSTYNKAGELVSMTAASDWSPTGTSTFKYDKNGVLRMATDGDGGNSYYLYDKAGRKTADINHYGWITEYRYDAANRVVAQIKYLNTVSAAHLTALADPNNTLDIATIRPGAYPAYDKWTWIVYDSAGRVIQTINGAGEVTALSYDNSNRLIQTIGYVNKLSQATIDGLKVTSPATAVAITANAAQDRVTRIFYDRDGREIGSLNAEGYLTENVYDKAGQLVEEIAYAGLTNSSYWASGTFNQLRSSISTTSTANRRTRNVYDGQGLKRYSVNAQGVVTRYNYNNAGRLTETTSFAAAIAPADFSYDNVKAAANAIANASNDRPSTINYNSRGQIASTTDAGGLTTYFTYDNRGNVTKVVAGDRVTRNWYTQRGELRFSVDGEGFVTEQGFDADSQTVFVIRYDTAQSFSDGTVIGSVSSAVAADYGAGRYQRVNYSYYANGGLYSTTDALGAQTITSYYGNGVELDIHLAYGTVDSTFAPLRYDGAGRIQYKYEGYGESEVTLTEYRYDGLGNLTSIVDPRGMTTTYSYDKLGRVTAMTDAAGGQTLYQYDAFGNQTAVRDARGSWSYAVYDNLGRMTQATDASGVVTTFSYTNFGERASTTRAGATTSFLYDKMGRVTRSTDALGFFETYAYNVFGNRTSKTAKSASGSVVAGGTISYTYDRRGLLISETLPMASYNSGGTLISSTVTNTFEYDARGNRTKMTEASGLTEARTTQYLYDKNDRLIRTIGQTFLGMTPSEYIYYDARGNVTSTINAAGGRAVYYYDDLNRRTVEISATGTRTKYSYDQNGNVTEARVYETVVAIPADGGSEEEAPAAPGGNSRLKTFTYDNLNRMLTSSVHGAKTGYWNGSSWVADTSAIVTQYQYDANGNVVKQIDGYGNATWSYYDALGRKTAQVDAENYITSWTYNAQGNVLSERRYANKAAAPSSTTTPPSVTANATLDRITDFSYDLNGNRTVEIRRNVIVHNGSGGTTTVDATIGYSYNGLRQVTRKTEATGDFVDYVYDAAGRLTLEARKPYTDFTGTSVTPTVDYYYDGLNNLSRTRQRGSGDTLERVTAYGYDGGKLRWITDPEGAVRYYWYDTAGNQTHEYYTRYKSDGSQDTAFNGNLTSYDVAGRIVSKWQADYTGNTWTTRGPVTQLTYNTFGELVGTTVGGLLQQQNQYDLAGRMTGTSSGDGIWKYFGYDKNGNQTVGIVSAGGGLGGSFDAALALVGQANVNASYTVYDKRNLATSVVDEGRQFSTGGAYQNLTSTRTYTAFGEVASETNAAGSLTSYSYNNMGRMIRTESPAVDIVHENGATQNVRPTEDYYYDASGRLVATRDANGSYSGQIKAANTGNLTILTLLTGTGYGNSQALVTAETHADGGIKQTKYDIHGNARVMIDEIGRQSTRTYDRMGRMVSVAHSGGLIDSYAYDLLGQQIKHWNNFYQTPVYGAPVWVESGYWGGPYYEPEWIDTSHWETPITGYTAELETTDYDIQGRVISQRSFGGDTTTATYSWDAGITTTGLGTFGGWLQVTTMANGLTAQEKTDLFGRVTWRQDLGGHATSNSYDVSGRMVSASAGGMLVTFTWFNSGYQASVTIGSPNAGQVNTNWTRDIATYSYNVVGNRLTEYMARETGYYTPESWYWNAYDQAYEYTPEYYDVYTSVVKNQTAGYDALGRMTSWAEVGTSTSPASSIANSYDANGNIRRTLANHYSLDANGAASYATTRDYWFRYDSMNRVVTDKGVLENGVIVRGMSGLYGSATGQDIMYDAAGQRTAVATTQAYFDGYGGYTAWEQRENYFYDAAGRLSSTYQATGSQVSGGYGSPATIPPASGTGTLRSVFSYDLMGRMSAQTDYDTNGSTALYSRTAYYNGKGQLSSDYAWTKKTDNKTYAQSNSYNYTDYNSGQYMLGSVAWMQSTSTVNGGSSVTSRTQNSYAWWGGAVQSAISHKPNVNQSTTYNTTFYLNNLGQLTGAYIADGKPRSVSFTLDELGQIIRRDETRPSNAPSGQTGSPHEVWYRFSGRQLGYTGNNGTSDIAYDASLAERRIVQPTNPGTYRNGQLYGATYADFAQSYDPINSYYQGAAGGSYRVNQGDTLQGIAQSIYGDSSLWYKIAEANGLSAAAALTEGQTLILPSGVVKNKHNAGTSNPYNAAEAIGDLRPTAPQPPKNNKNKCGIFGQILATIVAVAASYFLGPILGNLVSQGFNNLIGIQKGFSWKSLAMSYISASITAGLDGAFSGISNAFVRGFVQGATGSILTQGIGVATGLQKSFDFIGVAAAGVGSGIANFVSTKLDGSGQRFDSTTGKWTNFAPDGTRLTQTFLNSAISGTARGIAEAATRSAISGSNFGDTLMAALPTIIGNVAGMALARGLDVDGDGELGRRRSGGSGNGEAETTDVPGALRAVPGTSNANDPNARQTRADYTFAGIRPRPGSLRDIIGKLNALPITLAGVVFGIANLAVGAAMGRTVSIKIDDNAIQFIGGGFASGGAITFGNTQNYFGASHPDDDNPGYHAPYGAVVRNGLIVSGSGFNGQPLTRLGDHEESHTYQYERLGLGFFVSYLPGGIASAGNPFEQAADRGARGGSPYPDDIIQGLIGMRDSNPADPLGWRRRRPRI